MKFVRNTTDSSGTKTASPNLLKTAAKTGEQTTAGSVIIGDITYLPLRNGEWCYLAVWQDKLTPGALPRLADGGNDDGGVGD